MSNEAMTEREWTLTGLVLLAMIFMGLLCLVQSCAIHDIKTQAIRKAGPHPGEVEAGE